MSDGYLETVKDTRWNFFLKIIEIFNWVLSKSLVIVRRELDVAHHIFNETQKVFVKNIPLRISFILFVVSFNM